jgi:N-acetylmuramoyl-L-alanine amidase
MRFIALFILLLCPTFAARVGIHEGYTRIVFDLTSKSSYQTSRDDDTFAIRIKGQVIPPEDNTVDSSQVASYQIIPSDNDRDTWVYIRLKPNVEIAEAIFTDAGKRRLVVDVSVASAKPKPKNTPPKPPKIVVIDAGHGGIDPGAVGYVIEKQATLDIALRLRKLLQAQGIQVVLTRSTDTHLSQKKATDLGMRANMANSLRNLFVSIHVNSSPRAAQGIEVYYFGNTIDQSLLSQVIRENGGGELGKQLTRQAQSVADRFISDLIAQANIRFSRRLAIYTHTALLQATSAYDRGVRQAPFYVIRNARIPAILVEVGFTNHKVEGKKLATAEYRQILAQALATGITKFLDSGSTVTR